MTNRPDGSSRRAKRYIQTEYASLFSEEVLHYGFRPYHASLLEVITGMAAPGDGNVLEVGVGTGWPFTTALAEQGYTIYGVDIAEHLIRQARDQPGGVRCVISDAEALPFQDDLFELVYCLQSTWYFPDLARAIREMVRVARPGGTVVFDIMNLASARIVWSEIWAKRALVFLANTKRLLARRPALDYSFRERPSTPWRVSRILRSLPVRFRVVFPWRPQRDVRWLGYFNFRLLYICDRLGEVD